MMILALLTLLLITNGSAENKKTPVNGSIGHNVLLPCDCSISAYKLVWQKGERVLSVYPKNDPIDQDYMNRTENFVRTEKTNCSLKILNISLADEGVYTCYVVSRVKDNVSFTDTQKVNLTVYSEISKHELYFDDKSVTAASISVPILAVLLLAVAVILTLLIKRRYWTNTAPDLPAQQPMIEGV